MYIYIIITPCPFKITYTIHIIITVQKFNDSSIMKGQLLFQEEHLSEFSRYILYIIYNIYFLRYPVASQIIANLFQDVKIFKRFKIWIFIATHSCMREESRINLWILNLIWDEEVANFPVTVTFRWSSKNKSYVLWLSLSRQKLFKKENKPLIQLSVLNFCVWQSDKGKIQWKNLS